MINGRGTWVVFPENVTKFHFWFISVCVGGKGVHLPRIFV